MGDKFKGGMTVGFWIFMLTMSLVIPFTMIGFGRYFLKAAPGEINCVFGYRTAMSMKNQETWMFAHSYIGRIWYNCGLIFLPVSILVMALVIGKNETVTGTAALVLCVVQIILLVGAVISTEKALRRTFDTNGKNNQY